MPDEKPHVECDERSHKILDALAALKRDVEASGGRIYIYYSDAPDDHTAQLAVDLRRKDMVEMLKQFNVALTQATPESTEEWAEVVDDGR